MDEFQLDAELHATLKDIRESVRQLFEQLRLKHENGDISGKERLERVPALAKRNFAHLSGENRHLAIKQAWRLVDFLEGGADARLSPRAREALRVVELDKKLAAFAASDRWKQASARLRSALGADLVGAPPADPARPLRDEPAEPAAAAGAEGSDAPSETRSATSARSFPLRTALLIGAAALVAAFLLVAWRWAAEPPDDPLACLALEDASPEALAQHRSTPTSPPPARPPRAEAGHRVYTISDPPGGGPVMSTWTTSQYSFAERGQPSRPGGGRSDLRLRVGGWGDTYLSLLRIPVPSDRLAHRAVVQLTVLGDIPESRPTSMTLRAIGDDWRVSPGSHNRLWWKDCPRSDALVTGLPPPGPRGSVYEVDITDIYNMWAAGLRPPYGIILEPEQIGSWGADRPRYPSLSTFYSTRARDRENRPRLVLTY